MTSHHEAEGAHSQEGPKGEDRHWGASPGARRGLVLMGDLAAIAAIMKIRGSLHECS
jgi:hypothetical protein